MNCYYYYYFRLSVVVVIIENEWTPDDIHHHSHDSSSDNLTKAENCWMVETYDILEECQTCTGNFLYHIFIKFTKDFGKRKLL